MTQEPVWLDASAGLDGVLPVWPTSRGVSLERTRTVAADGVAESFLATDVHCGTHVDAPAHLIEDGGTLAGLPLEAFIGPALVVDATGLGQVDADAIARLVPPNTSRVLLRTDNSERRLMRRAEFDPRFVALGVSGAQELAARPEVVLVGNDYLSIQPYGGDNESHLALMRRGIAIVEGLDLADVLPGAYELVAAPLRLDHAEACPLRALLRPLHERAGS